MLSPLGNLDLLGAIWTTLGFLGLFRLFGGLDDAQRRLNVIMHDFHVFFESAIFYDFDLLAVRALPLFSVELDHGFDLACEVFNFLVKVGGVAILGSLSLVIIPVDGLYHYKIMPIDAIVVKF